MRTMNALGALVAATAVVSACKGGGGGQLQIPDRVVARGPVPEGAGVQPGISPQLALGQISNPYTGDRAAIAAGRQLFTGMNCAGCHSAYAGGGMGPSLRDSLWIYGSSDAQIFSTLVEGRPYGMPGWGGRLTEGQMWQLVAYIKTLGTADEPVKPPTPSQGNMQESPAPAHAGG